MLEIVGIVLFGLLFMLGIYDRVRAYLDYRQARERGEPTPGEIAAKQRADAGYQLWIAWVPLYNRRTGRIGKWTWIYFGVWAASLVLGNLLDLHWGLIAGPAIVASFLPLLNEWPEQ